MNDTLADLKREHEELLDELDKCDILDETRLTELLERIDSVEAALGLPKFEY